MEHSRLIIPVMPITQNMPSITSIEGNLSSSLSPTKSKRPKTIVLQTVGEMSNSPKRSNKPRQKTFGNLIDSNIFQTEDQFTSRKVELPGLNLKSSRNPNISNLISLKHEFNQAPKNDIRTLKDSIIN